MCNEPWIHTRGSYEISTSSIFLKLMKCLLRSLIHSKISNLTKIQRSSRKIFTAHYACRNAALNLTPLTGTTNGFIFQIINSLIESWGVHLTWFDCNMWKEFNSQGIFSVHKHGRRYVMWKRKTRCTTTWIFYSCSIWTVNIIPGD